MEATTEVTLVPAFDPAIAEYTVTVPYLVNRVDMAPAVIAGASYRMYDTSRPDWLDDRFYIISPRREIKIEVTGEDGITQPYTVTMIRQASQYGYPCLPGAPEVNTLFVTPGDRQLLLEYAVSTRSHWPAITAFQIDIKPPGGVWRYDIATDSVVRYMGKRISEGRSNKAYNLVIQCVYNAATPGSEASWPERPYPWPESVSVDDIDVNSDALPPPQPIDQVVPGDSSLTVIWTVAPRPGVADDRIRHALRWSQEAYVWANSPGPHSLGEDGIVVDGGVVTYTITDLENGVATGVFVSPSPAATTTRERPNPASGWGLRATTPRPAP